MQDLKSCGEILRGLWCNGSTTDLFFEICLVSLGRFTYISCVAYALNKKRKVPPMKKIETIVYNFSELSDSAKETARNWYRSGIDYEWYESVYEDAERIGLKITAFEIDRYCKGKFTKSPDSVAKLIISEHGDSCETTKTAKEFLTKLEEYNAEDIWDAIADEFLASLLEDYRIMLGKEWDYLNSDEQVDESIIANEYTFTADGERFG